MKFYDIYKEAYSKEASDIHLIVGKPIQLRIHGELQDLDTQNLSDSDISGLVDQVITDKAHNELKTEMDADYAYQFGKNERLRINIHYERGRLAFTARIIKNDIPSFEQIGVGKMEENLTKLNNGLIIVCGPTGSGKSTTLASMIDRINQERHRKIITVEDPVEFMFEHKQSVVEQREIGIDAPSFSSALRTIFRQDPNIIMVGEMRDKETIQQTLRIAETGHLVFSTLHTFSAPATILRIVDIFEPHEQRQVKVQLAENLRAVIFQQLVPSADGKRVAAREIMINNSATANIIRTGNFEQLETILQTSSDEGMITMDRALERLYKEEKKITKETYDKRKGRGRAGYSFY
ncbi:PilT/PilU family type 4a pilus ATPase [Candidatus Uhrbacteria bacterium]|nr:PilT/PilU family type 4a pilus ATPase [Candidatus Uhrbacteria bacterium]